MKNGLFRGKKMVEKSLVDTAFFRIFANVMLSIDMYNSVKA